MNPPDDTDTPKHGTWESEMGEEFERRVRHLHETPLDLSSVKGKAKSIRLRRRAAVAGGILAAAAVIVPVAVLANAADGRADDLDPAGPSVTITDTSRPTALDPSTPSLGFDYLEVGSGNAVLHPAGGGTIELPGKNYVDATDLGGQVAALRYDNPNGQLVDLIEDGQVVTTYDVRSDLAIAPDGLTVAFITTDDELVFVNGELGEQTLGTVDQDVTLSAIDGDGDCGTAGGCHPFLEYASFEQGQAFEIGDESTDSAPAPGALRVNDAEGLLVSVLTEATDTGTCGGLRDREGVGAWLFQTCDAQVLDISPTGEYVVGTDPYGDGLGPGYFSILDSTTGEEVARYETNPGFVYSDFTWADDTHAVAVVNDGGAWSIVALGVDGSVEELLGPVEGQEFEAPFLIVGS